MISYDSYEGQSTTSSDGQTGSLQYTYIKRSRKVRVSLSSIAGCIDVSLLTCQELLLWLFDLNKWYVLGLNDKNTSQKERDRYIQIHMEREGDEDQIKVIAFLFLHPNCHICHTEDIS